MCLCSFFFLYTSRLGAAARPYSIFHSIMHILSRQIGLISITLPQSGMDCALTSLPDHRWQRSSSQSLENCPAGFCEKRSDYRSRPLVLRCVPSHPFHISHTPSNSFPRKKWITFLPQWTQGLWKITSAKKQPLNETAGFSLRAAPVIVTPACFQTEISLCGRWKWHRAVLTDAPWHFMAKVNRIIVVQQRAFAKFSHNKASFQKCWRLSARPEREQTWRKPSGRQ